VNAEDARTRARELSFLNAFISLTDEQGEGPSVAVKDLIRVRGSITTGGGDILPRVPDGEDAPVIQSIRKHGCVVMGKASLHEWAYGPTSENPHYGDVRNPHDPDRVAGGSSGGSAVAVAAGMCDWSIGTDTGGSIRVPASLCGVVGIKPTLGAIGTEGVFPLSQTLDNLGPLARDVATAADGLAMMGLPRPEERPAKRRLEDYSIAVPADWVEGLDETVGAAWERISRGLTAIPFPGRVGMVQAARAILDVEAAANHKKWIDEDATRYGADVLKLLIDGMSVTGVAYLAAREERVRLREEAEEAMRGLDAILVPTTAIVAPPIGAKNVRDPLTRFTRPFNTTGQPVVTVPVRTDGLPVGVSVVGHIGRDWDVIAVAEALEAKWGTEGGVPVVVPAGQGARGGAGRITTSMGPSDG
jgi:aspartyl-tRNA(Asn)/glutamyl-tRNA(Gln) amidotransferase subunit A